MDSFTTSNVFSWCIHFPSCTKLFPVHFVPKNNTHPYHFFGTSFNLYISFLNWKFFSTFSIQKIAPLYHLSGFGINKTSPILLPNHSSFSNFSKSNNVQFVQKLSLNLCELLQIFVILFWFQFHHSISSINQLSVSDEAPEQLLGYLLRCIVLPRRTLQDALGMHYSADLYVS